MMAIFEPIGLPLLNGFSMVRVVANGPCKKASRAKWLYQSANMFVFEYV